MGELFTPVNVIPYKGQLSYLDRITWETLTGEDHPNDIPLQRRWFEAVTEAVNMFDYYCGYDRQQ